MERFLFMELIRQMKGMLSITDAVGEMEPATTVKIVLGFQALQA